MCHYKVGTTASFLAWWQHLVGPQMYSEGHHDPDKHFIKDSSIPEPIARFK